MAVLNPPPQLTIGGRLTLLCDGMLGFTHRHEILTSNAVNNYSIFFIILEQGDATKTTTTRK
jgi:hypothetical protein